MMSREDGDLDVIVEKIRTESSLIRSFELRPCAGGTLPLFEAGAHVDVFPQAGLCRQYSLVSDPTDTTRYVLGVKHELHGRGGSSAMHNQVTEGSQIRISQPRNNFALRPYTTSGRNLLFAGGIGVTPLLCMAQALHSRGERFELHYFAGSNQELAFRELISGSAWFDRVFFHLGLLPPLLNDVLDDLVREPDEDDLIYLCGPVPFMDAVRASSEQAGWISDALIEEHFSALPPKLEPGEGSFVIRLAKQGLDLTVPSDKSIINVLREVGIDIKTSCEQGVCGTCLTRVLEGEPEHNDLFLSDEEHESNECMTPCVSRSKSNLLVLDI